MYLATLGILGYMRKTTIIASYLFLVAATATSVSAEQPVSDKLPDILTLEYALSLADEPHPALLLNQADIMQSEAEQIRVDAGDDFDIYLDARLRFVEPSAIAYDQDSDDHRLGLVIKKDLYDFGRQEANSKSAQAKTEGHRFSYLEARAKRRLLIAQRFFDVLLADLVFFRYNEEMAVEYIVLDRLRARKELGRASDLQITEQEQLYQRVRFLRTDSQNEQRRSRARLAEAMNRPGNLPAELATPKLDMLERKLPEYEDLLKLAFDNNNRLKALRAQLMAAEQQLELARAQDNPQLEGRAEAYSYTREMGSYDDYRIGMTLRVPIYDGARTDADIAAAQAGIYRARARLQEAESEIRQAVLDTWLELDGLRVKREQMAAVRNFREMDLDHKRALYEMELRTDLGKGMARITEAQYLVQQADYQMTLAWIRLDILTGQLKLLDQQSTSAVK